MKNLFKSLFIVILLIGISNTAKADTTIHLDIETDTGSITNKDITVTPCDSDNDPITPDTESAYCAILQSGLGNTWSWFGTDVFLESIDTKINNDGGNGVYWGWFVNLNLGQTALNKYNLSSSDTILLTYNTNPLKISVDTETPMVGNNIIVTVSEFGYDTSWNPTWNPATLGKLSVGSNTYDLDTNGTYSLPITDINTFTIKGQKTSYLDSSSMTISPVPAPVVQVIRGGGGGAGLLAIISASVPTAPKIIFDLKKAFDFIISQQKDDGSFGEDIYTDWSTLSLATNPDYTREKTKLLNYFINKKISETSLTDYERHVMALMSAGQNPYDVNKKNYIKKITDSFDGKQFGDPNEDNDDIFALIVLQNTGYNQNDEIIKTDLSFILNGQKENGSWDGSIDMTGAGIEALSVFSQNEQIKNALEKARKFLKDNQTDNGSWGNISSTAWAIEGIISMNEKPEDWIKNNNTPLDYLASNQDTDGGIKNENTNNKLWETAYVVSALSRKTWNQIMEKFEKPKISINTKNTKEIKKTIKVSLIKNKNNRKLKAENLTNQNTTSTINAVVIPLIDNQTKTPKKSWFRKLLTNIFGF